jgi:hypothetical protein
MSLAWEGFSQRYSRITTIIHQVCKRRTEWPVMSAGSIFICMDVQQSCCVWLRPSNGPFGCGVVAMSNFGLYLTVVVSGFGATARAITGMSDRRTARSQVHHRHEERIP